MADYVAMLAKHVTITGPVADVINAEITCGRYKDFSAALNDAAWHYFIGVPSPFQEYGVTPAEVEARAEAELAAIAADRKAGKLVPL